MKASGWLRAVLVAALALAAVSCTTTDKALRAVSDPQVTAEADGVGFTLLFRDEESLVRQFRREANPFLTEYFRVSFRRIVVFELTVENGATVPYQMQQSDCELHFAGKVITPTNSFQLLNHWRDTDDNPRITSMREPAIRRHVLPNIVKVAPGGKVSGFLVFMGNLPNHGEARVTLPAPAAGEDPLEFFFLF